MSRNSGPARAGHLQPADLLVRAAGDCTRCNGTGVVDEIVWLDDERAPEYQIRPCPLCRGTHG